MPLCPQAAPDSLRIELCVTSVNGRTSRIEGVYTLSCESPAAPADLEVPAPSEPVLRLISPEGVLTLLERDWPIERGPRERLGFDNQRLQRAIQRPFEEHNTETGQQ